MTDVEKQRVILSVSEKYQGIIHRVFKQAHTHFPQGDVNVCEVENIEDAEGLQDSEYSFKAVTEDYGQEEGSALVVDEGRKGFDSNVKKQLLFYDKGVSGWNLPGHGLAYEDCGRFWMKGCLNSEAHIQGRLDGIDVYGKAYIKVIKRTCSRAECPVCHDTWAAKEAHRVVERLSFWKTSGKPIHLVISVNSKDWNKPYTFLRQMSNKIAKYVNFIGGSCMFHPFRVIENTSQWFFSPHFHLIGYGWIDGLKVRENFNRNGWTVINLGVRKSVYSTAAYQLGHAGVHENRHTITWIGALSYNKLRIPKSKEFEGEFCPVCEGELSEVMWAGDENSCSVPPEEGEYYVEPGGWVYSGGG